MAEPSEGELASFEIASFVMVKTSAVNLSKIEEKLAQGFAIEVAQRGPSTH